MRSIDPERLIRNVGERLGKIRREGELTQQQVADRLDVTLRYVQRVEAGEENLTLRSLAEFANALKVPPEELLTAPRPRKRQRGRPGKRTPASS